MEPSQPTVFFQINLSFLLEYGEDAIEKLRKTFGVFRENQGKAGCVFVPHENVKELAGMDKRLWQAYCGVVEEFRDRGVSVLEDPRQAEAAAASCAAYYGNAGAFAHRFRACGKPVMLMAV